ncbi:MAG: TatD family hydrolase [Ahrensia sp.]|nr:TatD family hydrolase [Ahrensia sp.]
MVLVDSHCHLDFPDFGSELDAVVARARSAGLVRMITICTRVAKFTQVLAVAKAYDDIYCSVGTHPHNAHEELDVTTQQLVALTQNPKVVAIGEAGLDYFYQKDHAEAQAQSLRIHIAAARQTGLPLVVHSRDADDDMRAILREETEQGAFPFVLHCFSSGRELAQTGIELGGYVSLSGIASFKGSGAIRDIASELPLDRLLVETDAPYLAPPPHRGKRNEPAFVAQTAIIMADHLGMNADDFAAQTTQNFYRLFSKVPRHDS